MDNMPDRATRQCPKSNANLLESARQDASQASETACVYSVTFVAESLTFEPCFSAPTFENFVALVLGWILCPGPHTISRAFREAKLFGLTDKHHSTAYRFFSRARWSSDRAGKILFTLLLPFLSKVIEVAVDDTLCHRSGPQVFGTGMHHDGSRSNYRGGKKAGSAIGYGHNWVILTVWVPYIARARKERPWDRQKSNPSYADMHTALRREFWVWRISRYPSLRVVRTKLASLLGAWLPAA